MLKVKWKEFALSMCLETWMYGGTEALFNALEESPIGAEDGVFDAFETIPQAEFYGLSKKALAAFIIHMAYTAQDAERMQD
jgi:hypothetical protein